MLYSTIIETFCFFASQAVSLLPKQDAPLLNVRPSEDHLSFCSYGTFSVHGGEHAHEYELCCAWLYSTMLFGLLLTNLLKRLRGSLRSRIALPSPNLGSFVEQCQEVAARFFSPA